MKQLLAAILILLSMKNIRAQKIIVFKDSLHEYVAQVATVFGGENSWFKTIKKVDVYNRKNKKKVQTITPTETMIEEFYNSNILFMVEDVNFDGYNDIRILNGTTLNGQTFYWYWFYNKATNSFKNDTTLEFFANPYFNREQKTMHTWWRIGFSNFGHALYTWQNKQLKLIVEEEEVYRQDGSATDTGIVITKRTVNGTIKAEEKKTQPQTIDYMHSKCNLR